VPPRASTPVRRPRPSPEAARRQAVSTLKLAEAIAGYGARQAGNGLGPAEAARTLVEVARELENLAGNLRRLAALDGLDPAARRRLVVQLAADGWSQRKIAAAVGVSKRTVWDDLHGR
jgi:DNA-directed RNA polymerase specialized sigma24 family protein